jgi:hypothetical protein
MLGTTPGAKLAIQCFNEAINLQGGPSTLSKKDPVQYDMLNGLANMAHAIELLQEQIAQLAKEVRERKSK